MVSHSNEQPKQPVLPAPAQGEMPQQADNPAPQQPGTAAPAQATPNSAGAMSAQDVDTIEPAWVERVEDALNAHAQNPQELARQLSAIKAEYVAGRYGVTLKQGSEQE